MKIIVNLFFRLLEGAIFIATIVALISIRYLHLAFASFLVGIGFIICIEELRKAAKEGLS